MSSDEKSLKEVVLNAFLENKELLEVMTKLYTVKTTTPKAQMKANATSMSDNNGKRIIYTLTEDMLLI